MHPPIALQCIDSAVTTGIQRHAIDMTASMCYSLAGVALLVSAASANNDQFRNLPNG